jgi:sugar lactone lactonase YvrE
MQATFLNKLMSPVRFFAAGTWAALFLAVTLLFSGARASAQSPIVVSGPATQIGIMKFTPPGGSSTGGGWDPGASPLSGTFVVGANGHVIIGDGYGAGIFDISPSGVQTVIASLGNSTAAAIDSYGNVYVAQEYNGTIFKLPYDASTGAYVGYTTAPTTNCLGGTSDTVACIFAPNTEAYAGIAAMAFDSHGNFFFASDTNPTQKNTIFECNVNCENETDGNGTYPATLLYADTVNMGAITLDPWGNLFFTDGANGSGAVSHLKELALVSGIYAASPTTLETYTSSAGGNGLSGVVSGSNGTIYFATNSDGIFAIPNSQANGPSVAGMYMVTNASGGKALTIDSRGNFYLVPYNNTLGEDAISIVPAFSFTLGSAVVGAASATTVNATVVDSVASCSTTVTAATTESGVTTTEFAATSLSGCATAFSGSNGTFSAPMSQAGAAFATTLSLTPAKVGERVGTLTISDTANNASGAAVLSGIGQGVLGNVDPGTLTTYTTGLTSPASVVADAAGDVFVADSGAGKVFEFSAGSTSTTTPTAVGSGFTAPAALAFDAKGNLFVADNGGPDVVEIPNTGTTGAFVAGTQQTLISSSSTFGGTALKDAEALAVGPRGTLYISDTGNKRVVSYNILTGQAGVTLAQSVIEGVSSPSGLENPQGLAVDASGNLYVADASLDEIVIVSSAGAVSAVTPPNVTSATGVAIDASGSLIVADSANGNLVRIPNLSGTLSAGSALTIETISPQASSLWMDQLGDLYVASAGGKSANAIQRTQGAINLGTVADGANNTGSVYLINAGNQAATLATPLITEPASSPTFSLEPAATNGCAAGANGPAGASCAFTAEFAPPAGMTVGPASDTADILFSTPSLSIPVTISGTASASAAVGQTITWNPNTTGYVGQVIALSATATSGLAVSFTTTTPSICTVAGNTTAGFTTSYIAVGSCTINANQAGGSVSGTLYGAAPTVTGHITVSNLITAADKPALLVTETNTYPSILTGGVIAGPISAGTSIGVGNNGYVALGETYGGSVAIYNLAAGTVAALGNASNPGGVTADSKGNLYISNQYNNTVVELPFVNGAYATLTTPGSTTPVCTGTPTTECTLKPIGSTGAIGGVGAITFDSHGDFFLVTDNNGTTQFSIWECTAACLASTTGSPAPVMIFQEPISSTPVTTGQLYIGNVAVDPWGNVYFTDSNLVNQAISSPNNEATYSDLYELPTSTGTGFGGVTTGFAATPTLLETYSDGSSPGGYDDNLDAVTVDGNGTIYFATLYDGVFAIPSTKTGPLPASLYVLSSTGAKSIAVDANGNVYEVSSALTETVLNPLTVLNAPYKGTPVTASATVVDNGIGYCSNNTTSATLAFAFTGSAGSDFSGSQGSGCKGISGNFTSSVTASSIPATITFTPQIPGAQTVTLNVSDTTNGGEGTATVSGNAQTTPQTISFTAPTTTTYTYTAPPSPVTITLSVANGGSNFPVAFSVDPSSTGNGTLSATTVTGTTSSATLTVTQAGTIQIDASEPGSAAGGLVGGVYYSPSNTATLPLTINPASQTITYTQVSPSTFTYSAAPQVTVQLSATGGASGNPVEFSVDPSSTGAGSITSSTTVGSASLATLTVTQAGSIVINASQAATTNYSAASVKDAQTLQVNQAAQTITFVPPTQPIYFIAASAGVAGGITVQVSAVGGGSDNPIVFSLDPKSTMTGSFGTSTVSGATSTATLAIPLQKSGATSGTIVIDATQPQSTDYAAVTVTPLGTLTILPPLATQLITFNNPGTQVVGTALTLAATASSGLPVSYTSSTTSVCTVSGSAVTFASGTTAASTCTIVAAQSGDNITWPAAPSVTQSFTVNPKGQSPNVSLGLSLSSLTIQSGSVGLTQLTITSQNNFTGALSLACSGLPSGYTCSFNPSTISSIAAGGTATTTLTVTPPASAALVRHDKRPFLPITALAVALCFFGFRKRTRLQFLVLAVIGLATLGVFSGCGGSSSTPSVKSTTSSATITVSESGMAGASGTVQQTATLSVTVE